jgi:hypothetical protein
MNTNREKRKKKITKFKKEMIRESKKKRKDKNKGKKKQKQGVISQYP